MKNLRSFEYMAIKRFRQWFGRPTLPNFLVIGAQKAGTTWLYKFLRSHPDIYVPPTLKEVMYFDVEQRYEALGPKGYAEYFESVSQEKSIGEVTPGYLWVSPEYPEWGAPSSFRTGVPERVAKTLGPDVKLIALLRDPIDRALSAYVHHRRRERIPADSPLSENWTRHGIVHIGFYGAHLRRWRESFPKRNFFVTTYERFFAEPEVRNDLLTFLAAEPGAGEDMTNHKFNSGSGFDRDCKAGAFDSEGQRIATVGDLQKLTETYLPDAEDLKKEWSLDLSWWQAGEG